MEIYKSNLQNDRRRSFNKSRLPFFICRLQCDPVYGKTKGKSLETSEYKEKKTEIKSTENEIRTFPSCSSS